MPIKVKDLNLVVEPPQLPEVVPVFQLDAPSLEARRVSIEVLRAVLDLGDVQSAELDHGTVIGNERGTIEYFHASGAVWADVAAAAREHPDEFRKWPGLQLTKRGDRRAKLDSRTTSSVLDQCRALLKETGLVGRDAEITESVELDQVARLDNEGNELAYGAGSATMSTTYAVEGIPVRGAGAKTLVMADPAPRGQILLTGAFHVWRPLGAATGVKMLPIEKAMSVGLLRDPELERYARAGHVVRLSKLELCYLALPAFVRQTYLFPMLQVEGSVSKGKRGDGFDFARYHHVAPPRAYEEAGLHAPYLAANPDGISPRGRNPRK